MKCQEQRSSFLDFQKTPQIAGAVFGVFSKSVMIGKRKLVDYVKLLTDISYVFYDLTGHFSVDTINVEH